MTNKRAKAPFLTLPALAMARAAQQLGQKYEDPGLVKAGAALEERAKSALSEGKPVLDPIN